MGARMEENPLYQRWSAGWMTSAGEVVVRKVVNGRGTARTEVTGTDGRTLVFRGYGEMAMAIYASGQRVRGRMSSEDVLALVIVGAARGDYVAAALADRTRPEGDPGTVDRKRFTVCNGLAMRLNSLTDRPGSYAGHPQWHPAWRVNELETTAVPAPRAETDAVNSALVVA